MTINVRYHIHSGFSLAINRELLVFDYWLGEHEELPASARITEDELRSFDHVYVFISHSHPDHYDPVVYTWADVTDVTYFIGYDLPGAVRGNRLWPGDLMRVHSGLTVRAFESTDLGVSFLVDYEGFRIFHAGDLNFWHWRDESTVAEIEQADEDFRKACDTLKGQAIDLCFFPVDPRQGHLYDAGAGSFIMQLKPRLFVPMHFWGRAELMEEFTRRERSRQTEIVVLSKPGERMTLGIEEDGYMTVDLPEPEEEHTPPPEQQSGSAEVNMAGYDGDDPFFNSDEPVQL